MNRSVIYNDTPFFKKYVHLSYRNCTLAILPLYNFYMTTVQLHEKVSRVLKNRKGSAVFKSDRSFFRNIII